jgi:hypothetical protein
VSTALALEKGSWLQWQPLEAPPMRRYSLLVILPTLVCLFAGAANSAQCAEDTIDSVSPGGETLTMISGAVYRVADTDEPDSHLWLPAEDVLICGHEIINKDEGNKSVSATKLRRR